MGRMRLGFPAMDAGGLVMFRSAELERDMCMWVGYQKVMRYQDAAVPLDVLANCERK